MLAFPGFPILMTRLKPRLLMLSLACLGGFVLLSWNYVCIPLANCRAHCLLWEVQFCWSGLAVCVRPPVAFGAAQHFQPPPGWCPASQGLCPVGGQGQQEVTGTGVESAQRGSPKHGACPSMEEGSEAAPRSRSPASSLTCPVVPQLQGSVC